MTTFVVITILLLCLAAIIVFLIYDYSLSLLEFLLDKRYMRLVRSKYFRLTCIIKGNDNLNTKTFLRNENILVFNEVNGNNYQVRYNIITHNDMLLCAKYSLINDKNNILIESSNVNDIINKYKQLKNIK